MSTTKDPQQKKAPVIQINQEVLHNNLSGYVRKNLENILNELPDAEADRLCHAKRYERNAERARVKSGLVCKIAFRGQRVMAAQAAITRCCSFAISISVFMTSGVMNSLKVLGLKRALPDCL